MIWYLQSCTSLLADEWGLAFQIESRNIKNRLKKLGGVFKFNSYLWLYYFFLFIATLLYEWKDQYCSFWLTLRPVHLDHTYEQECPKCHATIEKDGGCNHMVCKRCRFDFCWVCLGPWEPHGSSWYAQTYSWSLNVVCFNVHYYLCSYKVFHSIERINC